MPQSDSKAWMLAWFLFTAMPVVGAAEAYRQHVVAGAFDDASSTIAECRDLRPERSRAGEQRDRVQRGSHAQRRARDGAVAVLLLLAQGPRTVALR
jgi:hypothetical protein